MLERSDVEHFKALLNQELDCMHFEHQRYNYDDPHQKFMEELVTKLCELERIYWGK